MDLVLSGLLRIETRIETIRVETVAQLGGHADRIASLEVWRAFLTGGLVMISGVIGWIVGWWK